MHILKRLVNLSLFLCLSLYALAQTTALSPMPIQQYFDANGKPLSAGTLSFYASGTFNVQSVFADSVGTALSNPVTLNSGGYPENGSGSITGVWLTPGIAYRVQAKNAQGVQQWLIDGVIGLASSQNVLSTQIAYSATPVFSACAQHQFFAITLSGNVTASTFNECPGVQLPALVTIQFTQDAVGGRSFNWPPNFAAVATWPLLTAANTVTTVTFVWDGTTARPIGLANQGATGVAGTLTGTSVLSPGNHVTVLTISAPLTAQTGDGTDKVVYSYSLPAGALANQKMLRIIACASHNSGTASVSYKLSFGGQNAVTLASTSTSLGCGTTLIYNITTATQQVVSQAGTGALASWNSNNALTVDTTAAQTIAFTFNVANTDQVTPLLFSVELAQ